MAALVSKCVRYPPLVATLALGVALAVGILYLAARSGGQTPAPKSTLIPSFAHQSDMRYGYRMIVPSGWEVVDLGDARGFSPPGMRDRPDRVLLTVANLDTLARRTGEGTEILPHALWESSRSLPVWTEALEENWRQMGVPMRRERSLPGVRIYSLTPTSDEVQLVAYAIDGDQPLVVQLLGRGVYGNVSVLRRLGLMADFETMVESARAK